MIVVRTPTTPSEIPMTETPRSFRRIAVFCGSNTGRSSVYAESARHLGRLFLERDIGLVYGGGNVGLMGILADTLLDGGGEVLGVIPKSLEEREVAHHGITELTVVQTMHERKQKMYDLADAVIAMPGGIGTLDELFESWTWNQLGYLNEPCGLLNITGYFQPLVDMLDRMVTEGFLRREQRDMLQVSDRPEELLDLLAKAQKPGVDKWIKGGPS